MKMISTRQPMESQKNKQAHEIEMIVKQSYNKSQTDLFKNVVYNVRVTALDARGGRSPRR